MGTLTFGERAAAILRDEIEHGALANIAAASQAWSTHHRDLLTPGRLAAEFGGVLDTVLDLLAPPPRSAAASSRAALAAVPDHAADQGRQTIEAMPVLRAQRSAPLGGATEIHTRLQNDGPVPAEVSFVWSDLVAEPDGRIHADCLRLLPVRVRVPPGACADLAIGLQVPGDARPGLYHALLQSTERMGLRAMLTFPVGLEC